MLWLRSSSTFLPCENATKGCWICFGSVPVVLICHASSSSTNSSCDNALYQVKGSEWVLSGFCMNQLNSKRVPNEFWMHSEWVLRGLSTSSAWALNDCWLSSEWVLIAFWIDSEWVLREWRAQLIRLHVATKDLKLSFLRPSAQLIRWHVASRALKLNVCAFHSKH